MPHLRGLDRVNAYRCLGYAHGLDRAFQMDYFRRVAQGRQSEIFGTRTVKADFQMRLIGLSELAKRVYGELEPATRAIYDAYAEGATEGMFTAADRGVYEFKDFGYLPAPWKGEDSVAVLLLQSFDQTRRSFEEKVREAKRLEHFGERAPRLFSFDGLAGDKPLPWLTTVLKPGEYPVRESRTGKSAAIAPTGTPPSAPAAAFADLPDLADLATGSNNWVIAPRRSASGRAWLANDPHLSLKTPSYWHWSHIESSDGALDVVGSSVPGIPVIASGANRYLAWGLTNSYLDVADLYEVPEKDLLREGTRTIRPVVKFRVWQGLALPIFFKTFEITREGWPVLPIPATRKGHVVVLRWAGFTLRGSDLTAFQEFVEARSAREIDTTLSRVGVPSWNLVFADTKGAIGYRAVGRIPRRVSPPAYGLTLLPSLDQAPRWEYLSADEMPHLFDPAKPGRDFIVTANNRQWGLDSKLAPGRNQYSGTRAFRIEELLGSVPRHDIETQRKVQCDDQAVDARFIVPGLLALAAGWDVDARERAALELLKGWDFRTGLDCRPCGVFRFWMEMIYEESRHTVNSLHRVLADTADAKALSTVARKSLASALDALGIEKGSPTFPVWGEVHRIEFEHLSGDSRYKRLEKSFLPTPGDDNTVSPGTGELNGRMYKQTAGASQRVLTELTSPPRLRMVLPSLESDEPVGDLAAIGSPWRRWRDCEYGDVRFPLDWSKLSAEQLRTVRARWER